MGTWLAAAVTVSLAASQAWNVEPDIARSATAGTSPATSNFRLRPTPQFKSPSLVQDGMIAQEELAPNAHVGVGLASMLGRNIHSVLIERELVPTRNPGVSFVFKFPQ